MINPESAGASPRDNTEPLVDNSLLAAQFLNQQDINTTNLQTPKPLEDFNSASFSDQANYRTAQLSIEEICARMATDGFPELNLLWQQYLKSSHDSKQATTASLTQAINAHTKPLFGFPKTVLLATSIVSIGLASAYHNLVFQNLASTTQIPLAIWLGANISMLGLFAITAIQRYWITPLMKTMSNTTGFMLRQLNFSNELISTARFKNFREKSTALMITNTWDNPDYKQSYQQKEGQWFKVHVDPLEVQIHNILQDFLGKKDDKTRIFSPGKFFSSLKDGKKSVTRFIKEHSTVISDSKAGLLTIDQGIELIKKLREQEVLPATSGSQFLDSELKRLSQKKPYSRGVVVAEVWQRNPWQDLTHQEEFFSSASLRGVKKMGRDSKGRLGTFNYILNPSICALDFSTSNGRVVRARCGLVELTDHSGKQYTAIFVDGVEGSNSLAPDVILKALLDYSHSCNVDLLCIYANPLNAIPRRFVQYVSGTGIEKKSAAINYLDSTSREYLDAFGIPIQPFEYAWPKGKVSVLPIKIKDQVDMNLSPPGFHDNIISFLKEKIVWAYFIQAAIGSSFLLATISFSLLLPLCCLFGAAATYQILFHRKSLNVFSSNEPIK